MLECPRQSAKRRRQGLEAEPKVESLSYKALLLMAIVERLAAVLDSFFSGYFVLQSSSINNMYLLLIKRAKEIADSFPAVREELDDVLDFFPNLYEAIADPELPEENWEYDGQARLLRLKGRASEIYVEQVSMSEPGELARQDSALLDAADEILQGFRKEKAAMEKRWLEGVERAAEKHKAAWNLSESVQAGTHLGIRMGPEEAQRLINEGEGQQVEFKKSFAEAREAIESLCAFSNADGGSVFFGVDDGGRIAGLTVGKKTLEDFANQLRANTEPSIAPRIEQLVLGGKTVVAATVDAAPRDNVVHAFNVARIRVGKTNQVMSPEQQKERYLRGFQTQTGSRAGAEKVPRELITHVREARRVGGEDDPAVYAVVTVENPQGENAFVDEFEMEMLQPVRARPVKFEFRSSPHTRINHLALNVPGHGISEPVIIIATFDAHVTYESDMLVRVAAAARGGLRRRWTTFACPRLK